MREFGFQTDATGFRPGPGLREPRPRVGRLRARASFSQRTKPITSKAPCYAQRTRGSFAPIAGLARRMPIRPPPCLSTTRAGQQRRRALRLPRRREALALQFVVGRQDGVETEPLVGTDQNPGDFVFGLDQVGVEHGSFSRSPAGGPLTSNCVRDGARAPPIRLDGDSRPGTFAGARRGRRNGECFRQSKRSSHSPRLRGCHKRVRALAAGSNRWRILRRRDRYYQKAYLHDREKHPPA